MRILRGAEPEGLVCREIGERTISHDPDITRLLDRMEKRGLITRERQTQDRQGLALRKTLDHPVEELPKDQFGHMTAGQTRTLASRLEQIRAREAE